MTGQPFGSKKNPYESEGYCTLGTGLVGWLATKPFLLGGGNQTWANGYGKILSDFLSIIVILRCHDLGSGSKHLLFASFFIPIWGNDPIWLAHLFQIGWFNHQVVTKIFLAWNMKPSWSIELDFSSFQKISSEDVSIFSPIFFTVEWNWNPSFKRTVLFCYLVFMVNCFFPQPTIETIVWFSDLITFLEHDIWFPSRWSGWCRYLQAKLNRARLRTKMIGQSLWRIPSQLENWVYSSSAKSRSSGWWQLTHFLFSSLLGEMIQFD